MICCEIELTVDTAVETIVKGGANFVEGSFTVGTDTTQDIEIPYEGNGYPIACSIWIDGGIKSWKDADFINADQPIGSWSMQKSYMDLIPDYSQTTGTKNEGSVTTFYPMGNTSTSYFYDARVIAVPFSSNKASQSIIDCAKFNSNTVLNVYTGGGYYSFAQGCTYRYFVVYSE